MVSTLVRLDRPARHVQRIVLNRPERLNALSDELLDRLLDAIDEVEMDDDVHVAILTGEGRAFCAGADLSEHYASGATSVRDIGTSFLWERLEHASKPFVAAVHGHAVTGGFLLALCCDLIIAAEGTQFRDTHAMYGLIPTGGETQRLPRRVGASLARELMLTSRALGADEALARGLLTAVVPPAELQSAALALAESVAANSPRAVSAIKRAMSRGAELSMSEALRIEQAETRWGAVNHTPDADRADRLAAFARRSR